LEERFPGVLAVVGVHAGKYSAERKTDRIASACERLRVKHPVVNDRQLRIWRSYAVQAWPTIAIVTPDGHLLTVRSGEFPAEELIGILERAVAAYDAEGLVDRGSPLPTASHPKSTDTTLRFPSRVLARGDRLYVSDSGHDRVLELRLLRHGSTDVPLGMIERSWGCGEPGLINGTLEHSAFCMPMGLIAHGDTLYVADRGNHAVRAIGLADSSVTTIAGTGALAPRGVRAGSAASTALRSPWGLTLWAESLVISMAGSHQLWRLSLGAGATLSLFAGAGGEALVDGPAAAALLAQPMGVTASGDALYFADAESSSVRRLVPGPPAEVDTLVGTGLFDFGDKDGSGDDAELQHAEDVAWSGGALIVADTYNDKLKRLDPVSRECRALPGEAGSGHALRSPGGVAARYGQIWVADTDAHRIAMVDALTGDVSELEID